MQKMSGYDARVYLNERYVSHSGVRRKF